MAYWKYAASVIALLLAGQVIAAAPQGDCEGGQCPASVVAASGPFLGRGNAKAPAAREKAQLNLADLSQLLRVAEEQGKRRPTVFLTAMNEKGELYSHAYGGLGVPKSVKLMFLGLIALAMGLFYFVATMGKQPEQEPAVAAVEPEGVPT